MSTQLSHEPLRQLSRSSLVYVPLDEVTYACRAAKLAAQRIRERFVKELVDKQLARAHTSNARWWARGPLRRNVDEDSLRQVILAEIKRPGAMKWRIDEIDDWMFSEISVRMIEDAACNAEDAFVRPDGIVVLSMHTWHHLDVFRRDHRFRPAGSP
jgi:hypothetical protein